MTIDARNISMKFPLKTALDDISVSFSAGKIHALLGENGAGKSTLAAIISGNRKPTGGALFIDGKEVHFESPREALEHGIVIVQQRPLLSLSLTATENLQLLLSGGTSRESALRSYFAHRSAVRTALQTLHTLRDAWAPALPLNVPVQNLGGNHRFYIAFLGALLLQPRFLILDEPSAFLDVDERKALYEHLREETAKSGGMTVLVITHSSAEAETYADTVTLLKRGTLSSHYESADAYKAESAHGASLTDPRIKGAGEAGAKPASASRKSAHPVNKAPSARRCFELEHVSCRPANKPSLFDATLCACYGEITAVAGIKEAALDTLEDVVTGMVSGKTQGKARFYPPDKGAITLNLAREPLTTSFLRTHKTAIVPSDRTFRASHPALTVEQMLTVYSPLTAKAATKFARTLISKAGVNITPQEKTRNLSGGMLQRLILARELSLDPDFVIFCNPLQGLDIAGQRRMTEIALELAHEGKAVLIVGAADFPLSLCARVYRLESGRCELSFEAAAAKEAVKGV